MTTVDIVGLLIPVTYFVFLVLEKLWPARISAAKGLAADRHRLSGGRRTRSPSFRWCFHRCGWSDIG